MWEELFHNFANAITITGASGVKHGSNGLATVQVGEPATIDSGTGGKSIWYNWTAPASGSVTFDTIGSDFDTLLAAYTGAAVGSLVSIAENDDGAGIAPRSRITFTAVSGTTYRIRVDGFSGDSGLVTLNWA